MQESGEKMEKNDKRQVSCDMMRTCRVNYQQSVKAARAKYLKILFPEIHTLPKYYLT